MGTGTLLHAALARPERFERLVLTAPPTAWETRRAQVDLYSAQAALVEAQGLDALLAMYAQAPIAPIFRDLPDYKIAPDIPSALLPSVFRGAGLADFPSPDALRSVSQPTLILAWATDPGHPVSSAEKLSELLPHAELHVSETSADIRTWGERAARFLAG
jgi:3-oxoadipate enol-lactonase